MSSYGIFKYLKCSLDDLSAKAGCRLSAPVLGLFWRWIMFWCAACVPHCNVAPFVTWWRWACMLRGLAKEEEAQRALLWCWVVGLRNNKSGETCKAAYEQTNTSRKELDLYSYHTIMTFNPGGSLKGRTGAEESHSKPKKLYADFLLTGVRYTTNH